MRNHSICLTICTLSLVGVLTGCTTLAPAPAAAKPPAPRVFFTAPADGAAVSSPVQVTMAAEALVVVPAGNTVIAGRGRLHIMVDTDCVEPGQGIPKDDSHLHFGKGQMEASFDLPAGEHTLCLQGADGLHVALAGSSSP